MRINPYKLRKIALKMIYEKQSGHIGSSFSIAEIVAYLYSNYDLVNGKDKLILSKGHAVPIIYAALNELGVISAEELTTFREIDSRLQGHPYHKVLPELMCTTGSLGQGISIAVGHAIAKNIKNEEGTIFCIIGDGELQEGQCIEAFSMIGRMGFTNIVVFVDHNDLQSDGRIDNKTIGFMSDVRILGNDMSMIESTFSMLGFRLPFLVHLYTKKGFGFPGFEKYDMHSFIPSESQYIEAIKYLEGKC